jgi:hypothetical protein
MNNKSKSRRAGAKRPSSPKANQPQSASQWVKLGFVGHQNGVSQTKLKEILSQIQQDSTPVYFLKWFHKVSGMVITLPADFPSPEGQMFTEQFCLRWQRQNNQYDVLFLSATPLESEGDWRSLSEEHHDILWETRTVSALPHDVKNPQYPNSFIYEGVQPERIRQRYFRDANTGIIHFVVPTVKSS